MCHCRQSRRPRRLYSRWSKLKSARAPDAYASRWCGCCQAALTLKEPAAPKRTRDTLAGSRLPWWGSVCCCLWLIKWWPSRRQSLGPCLGFCRAWYIVGSAGPIDSWHCWSEQADSKDDVLSCLITAIISACNSLCIILLSWAVDCNDFNAIPENPAFEGTWLCAGCGCRIVRACSAWWRFALVPAVQLIWKLKMFNLPWLFDPRDESFILSTNGFPTSGELYWPLSPFEHRFNLRRLHPRGNSYSNWKEAESADNDLRCQ